MTATVRPIDDNARWFKRFGRSGTPEARLFCFHHAGGTAAMFRGWPRLLPASVDPVAVQLPGRADRFREPAFDTMWPLVDALVEVLDPLLDRPYAFYGVSMGGKIAWALTHRLRARALPLPSALFLASVAAPGWPEGRSDWNDTEALLAYLHEMGGTPPEFFEQPDLLVSLLPTLRADLTLVDSFHYAPDEPLDVPIHAFAGADDVEGPAERMTGWGGQSRGPFALDVVSGGHFFDAEGERRVVRVIADDLERELAGHPPAALGGGPGWP